MNNKIIALFTLAVALILTAMPIQAQNQSGWETNLIISINQVENKIGIGQNSNATNLMDGAFDVPALLAGILRVYSLTDEKSLWRDIRGIGENSWTINVETSDKGIVTIKWDTNLLPENSTLTLVDGQINNTVDMKTKSNYSYKNTGKRTFTIVSAPIEETTL